MARMSPSAERQPRRSHARAARGFTWPILISTEIIYELDYIWRPRGGESALENTVTASTGADGMYAPVRRAAVPTKSRARRAVASSPCLDLLP